MENLLDIPAFLRVGTPEHAKAKADGAAYLKANPWKRPRAKKPHRITGVPRNTGTRIPGVSQSDLFILKGMGWTEKVLRRRSAKDNKALLEKLRHMTPADEVRGA